MENLSKSNEKVEVALEPQNSNENQDHLQKQQDSNIQSKSYLFSFKINFISEKH